MVKKKHSKSAPKENQGNENIKNNKSISKNDLDDVFL